MRRIFAVILILVFLTGCLGKKEKSIVEEVLIPTTLISKNDLEYLGAFRLPDGTSDTESWAWGGTAMTYFPGGDPNGSLSYCYCALGKRVNSRKRSSPGRKVTAALSKCLHGKSENNERLSSLG